MVSQVQGHCNINLFEIETTQKGVEMGTFNVTRLGSKDSRRELEGASGGPLCQTPLFVPSCSGPPGSHGVSIPMLQHRGW